jgi:hypothetical protein
VETRPRITTSEKIGIGGICAIVIVGFTSAYLQPIKSDQLGIAGIAATIIIGIAIFLMQRRADQSVNDIIHHEDERKKSIKKYFWPRIDSDFERVNKYHEQLKKKMKQYLENKSDESWNDLIRFAEGEFPQWVMSFMRVTNDIAQIVPLLDNPRLIDQYHNISNFSIQLVNAAQVLSDYRNRDDEILKIQSEIDDTMKHINWFRDALSKEVDRAYAY